MTATLSPETLSPETLEPSVLPSHDEPAVVDRDDAVEAEATKPAEGEVADQPKASADGGAATTAPSTEGGGGDGEAEPSTPSPTDGDAAVGDVIALDQATGAETGSEVADVDAAAPSPEEAIAPAAAAVNRRAATARVHTPADAAAGSAQMAAVDPGVQQRRGAAVGTVGRLDDAEPADVDRVSFKRQLMEALKAAVPTPKTEEDAERLMNQGAANASAQLRAEVGTQTSAAAGDVTAATSSENEVSPDSVDTAPASVLSPQAVGEAPAPVAPDSVVPDPLAPERLDYSANSADADTLMAENEITSEQLARGGEPDFDAVLGARSEAETNNVEGPAVFRQSEDAARQESRARAAQSLGVGIQGIHGTRAERITAVASQQTTTQSTDAAERLRITGEIERIKTATRDAVDLILTEMETGATSTFEDGLTEAEEAYEEVFEDEKGGFFSWLGGSITGSWDETVERAFRVARRAYEDVVNRTIDAVATFVEQKLAQAKARVAEGKLEVDGFVAGLDSSVAAFGEEAKAAIGGDFDAMVGDIDSRRDGLVDSLAQQYGESQRRVSAMEERLREENKSLWDAVYDATVGVVQKIIEFKNMLLGLLAKAAAVVSAIIDDPIGFLGNLITGIKAGLDAFVGNIGEHLKNGLMGWLFGALQGAGLKLPDTFDLKGILDLVLQVLGLTKENIRKRAVRLLGESLVARLEQAAGVFMILATEGPAGLWRMIVEKIGDIKTMILGQIENFVITEIVKAGVKWLLGLLNPAAAFIKACMMIYDIVKFFIERGSQIIALVDSIIGALGAIVGGNIKAMADAVEGALARILPVAISFLASLLGLGGISEKIREIIDTIQKPVMAAIDWVIQKAVALARKVGSLFGGGKNEEADEGSTDDSDPEKAAKVQAALLAIDQAEQRSAAAEQITLVEAQTISAQVLRDHPVLTSLTVVDGGETWDYEYAASPPQTKGGPAKDDAASFPHSLGATVLVRAPSGSWEVAVLDALPDERGIVWFAIGSGKNAGSRLGLPEAKVREGETVVRAFDARAKGEPPGPYAELEDPPNVGPYKHFTELQKVEIIALNRKQNGDALKSDETGSPLVAASARRKGRAINPNEVNIDHHFPRSKGGWNTYANARVLSFSENLQKLDRIPDQ